MIGIICPSAFEYKALSKALFKDKRVDVVLSGMGKVRALHAASKLHKKHSSLQWILLIGFAGGLTPDLKVGDLIEPSEFVEQDYCAEPFEKFPNKISIKTPSLVRSSKRSIILTQDRFLTENPYAKSKKPKKVKSIACDMESYAVAYFCKTEKIKFKVIKLISDSADKNADHDFLKACTKLAPKLNQVVLSAVAKCCSFKQIAI